MNKYDRTIFDLNGITSCIVDVYRVIDAFNITNAPIAHAIKKLLCAGLRGAKSAEQDYREALESVEAAIQMYKDKEVNLFRKCPNGASPRWIYGKYGSGNVQIDNTSPVDAFEVSGSRRDTVRILLTHRTIGDLEDVVLHLKIELDSYS